MRINQFLARATGMSRRAADSEVTNGSVYINGQLAKLGDSVSDNDKVQLGGRQITPNDKSTTVIFNKPVGYICSRNGQGGKTIYDLLSKDLHRLKPVGRLDKDSSGLLLLTNDGQLANDLMHPSRQKQKVYNITLNKPLQPLHRQMISDRGIQLDDGVSKFELNRQKAKDEKTWVVTMHEGRNRQIRRTFNVLGYKITKLHRTTFGRYKLGGLASGDFVASQNNSRYRIRPNSHM